MMEAPGEAPSVKHLMGGVGRNSMQDFGYIRIETICSLSQVGVVVLSTSGNAGLDKRSWRILGASYLPIDH